MKRITNIILLSAGILLSLMGCQKGPSVENLDNLVRFSASTGTPTRTVYSGVVKNNAERINWIAGDKIIVWSDNATVRPQGTNYFPDNDKLAVYTIANVQDSNDEKSIADIEDPAGNGLQYPAENPGTILWGVYPASAVTDSPVNNSVPFEIEAEQDLAKNTVTTTENSYVPDMNKAYMVAYVSGAKAGESVELPFTPAYTDFEFNITTKLEEPLTITAMEITSTTTPMSGKYTATCSNGTWDYTIDSKAALSVKAVLPGEGLTIDADNPTLSLNVFALPKNMTNLTVTFYTNEGTKSLKLRDTDKTTWLTFAGAKKHVMNGLLLPTGWYFNYITLDLKVLEWEAEDYSGDSANLPQATQFIVTGAKNGYEDLHVGGDTKDPYRQQWYFLDNQTVKVTYKIMLPVGGSWELEPIGGTEASQSTFDPTLFEITGGTVSPAVVEGENKKPYTIVGEMAEEGATHVELTIKYIGPAGEAHSFFFRSYVYDAQGNKFNIDSETQIYDRGRGYHTFFANTEPYTTD